MTKEVFPFAFIVNAAQVVNRDQKVLVQPDQKNLELIARTYEVNGIRDLKGDFVLKPYRKAGIRVLGPITAVISQTCVASLEPFDCHLEIDVDRTFEPYSTRQRKIRDLNDNGEIEIDLETLDPPDVMIDGVLDLGALICEEMALVLDPFPRKPGVEFDSDQTVEPVDQIEDVEKPSAFAALEALKNPANK
ncbi:MAG: DUF177 domain-containing protein [Roseibium sp.]